MKTIRAFMSDAEAASLRALCDAAGASATTTTELLVAVEEARCLDEMLRLFALGQVTPYMVGGQLRWKLTDAARLELAEKVSAAVLREAGVGAEP